MDYHSPHPISKLFSIWDSGRQENYVNMVRKHYDNFFPYNTALIPISNNCLNIQQTTYLRIINIVNFVKNYKFDISNKICSLVQHASQNLGGHHQTSGLWVDLNVSCQDSN
jgi:hypothetical protein